MDVFEAMRARRSVRAYSSQEVGEEKLMQVLEAARIAPSWKNYQCWRYIVVSDRELMMKIGEAVRFNPNRSAYENASYLLVVCADPSRSGIREDKPYYMADAAISMDHAVLAAQALGLGTCWVGAFLEQPVKELLGMPDEVRIVAMTPLGVPAEAPGARPRKPLGEIAFSNRWGAPLDI